MRILLVEDDLQICEVTKKYFESKGAEVVVVNNGTDALAYAESGLEGYSLVLLDIMLPGADGFVICRSIRRHSDIPVIFLTARGREEDILHGYELGC
ncbi:MAG: response regulator, partial [Lachnospiraceae bacterium]|nr:response regulator [Lachnospiraceae bacterium]